MTKTVSFTEVSTLGDVGILLTDKVYNGDDTIIAQTETTEQAYEIHSFVSSAVSKSLKKDHFVYILKKKD